MISDYYDEGYDEPSRSSSKLRNFNSNLSNCPDVKIEKLNTRPGFLNNRNSCHNFMRSRI